MSTTQPRPPRRALAMMACVAIAGLGAPAVGVAGSGAAAPVPSPARPAAGNTEVIGIVTDEQGTPLTDAAVSLGGAEDRTGADGRWSITLAPGTHALEVSLDGELEVVSRYGLVVGHGHHLVQWP